MAEVISNESYTVIVLDRKEWKALAQLLHDNADDDTIGGHHVLYELYDAFVPANWAIEDMGDEPIGYALTDAGKAEVGA